MNAGLHERQSLTDLRFTDLRTRALALDVGAETYPVYLRLEDLPDKRSQVFDGMLGKIDTSKRHGFFVVIRHFYLFGKCAYTNVVEFDVLIAAQITLPATGSSRISK